MFSYIYFSYQVGLSSLRRERGHDRDDDDDVLLHECDVDVLARLLASSQLADRSLVGNI